MAFIPKQAPKASMSILAWPIIKTFCEELINEIKESAKTRVFTLLRFSWASDLPP